MREDGRPKIGFFARLGRWGLILVILGGGLFASQALRLFAPSPEVEEPDESAPLVEAQALRFETSSVLVRGYGLAEPRARIRLAAQVGGEVASVSTQMVSGGAFKEGDILLEIDTRIFEAALMEAKADKTSADARHVYAKNQFERAKKLHANGHASKERVDQLRSQYAEAQANAERATARVLRASLDLEHARVAAPFDGRVASEAVDVGTYLTPGALIGEIFATDIIEIVVSLSDEEASLLPDLWRSGTGVSLSLAPATITSEYGGNTYQWNGAAHRVESEIDNATRTVDVVVRVTEPTETLRLGRIIDNDLAETPPLLPGMYTQVKISGRQLSAIATIPRSALRPGDRIWTVTLDNKIKTVPVRVLQQQQDFVVIQADGIASGTLVVTSNLRFMSDGMKVRVRAKKSSPEPVAALANQGASPT